MPQDPVEITYIGDYSGLDVIELGMTIERGVPFMAPAEYAARQMGFRPTQWVCSDPDVQAAATVIEQDIADELAEFNRQFMSDDEREVERIAKVKDELEIPVEEP